MYVIDLANISTLRDRVGQEIAVSEWLDVSQDRINRFADATDDRQWIHVEPERASAESPFGTTIAHGFLTLSLLSVLARRAMTFNGLRLAVNYGLNRVRFMAPVPAGSSVRGRFALQGIDDLVDGFQVTWVVTIERDGSDKPCAVAEWVTRYYGL